jgi:hypothetical protein
VSGCARGAAGSVHCAARACRERCRTHERTLVLWVSGPLPGRLCVCGPPQLGTPNAHRRPYLFNRVGELRLSAPFPLASHQSSPPPPPPSPPTPLLPLPLLPSRIYCISVIVAVLCLWLMWVSTWMHQWHPIIYPILPVGSEGGIVNGGGGGH